MECNTVKSKNHKPRKPRNRRPTRGKASRNPKRSGTKQSRTKAKAPIGVFDPANPNDRALSRVKQGETQQAAAKAEGISVKSLRNFMKKNTRSKWMNGKWEINDPRAVYTLIFEDGQLQSFPFRKKAASKIGKFWNAVNEALLTNDPSHIAPFRGVRVRDAYNKYHVFDTDLNALRRADSIGDLAFHTLYDQTVN